MTNTTQATLPNIDAFADTAAQPVLSFFDDVADDYAAANAPAGEVCLGYLVDEHNVDAVGDDGLCSSCADRLDREVRPYAYGVYPKGQTLGACPNGHTDRTAHYFDCLYCYGD